MRRLILVFISICFTFTVFAQTTYDWIETAPDGNWKRGADGARWNPGGLWDEPPTTNILRFNNNGQLSMTNNVSSYNIHQLIFGSSNTSNRSIGGNDLSFSDWGGTDPKIENQSTGSHSISLNITGDINDPLELNPVSGDLTFSGNLINNGSDVYVWGDISKVLTLSGVVSGTGKLIVQQYSIVKLSGASTFTGDVEIDEGELWFEQGGAVGGGTIYVGNGAQQADIAKLWHSDMDGGTTVDENIVVNSANSSTKYIGGLNASGTNTYSGTITVNGPVNLESNQSGGVTQFTGNISGSNNVTISGSGEVQFVGVKTYSGSTTILAGTLEVQNDLSTSGITVQNGGTLEINGDVDINALTVESGGIVNILAGKYLTINGNYSNSGTVTINSDATGTGSLIIIGTITGDLAIERYLAQDLFHYITSPINYLSGSFNDLSMGLATGDDFRRYETSTNTWVDILNGPNGNDPTMGSETFVQGKGYAIAYAGENKTLSLSGLANNGDIDYAVSSGGVGLNAGTNLVGNPYPSSLKVSEFLAANNSTNGTINTTISGALYFWDEPVSGDFVKGDYASRTSTTG
nr:hypothetical protein [Bacteroidota bacterium]